MNNMNGKLIVIEGLDGCGKQTQTELLVDYFKSLNLKVRHISFPDYESESSALVKMYLNSEFGNSPDDVNAYAASSFYAVDRFASFKKDWGKDYLNGCTIICDRYTTSNAFYQMCKLEKSFWDEYLTWLYDYEYNKLGLPKPYKVIFLNLEVDISQKLLSDRYAKGNGKKDLHETDIPFLKKSQIAAKYIAAKDNWHIIACSENNKLKTKEEIHKEILKII